MKPTILMSIHKQYIDQMKKGTKKYEYRSKYRKEKTLLIMYETSPTMAITAIAKMGKPKTIPSTDKYNLAIPVEKIYSVKKIKLKYIQKSFPKFKAPQSYLVLENNPKLKNFIFSHIEKHNNIMITKSGEITKRKKEAEDGMFLGLDDKKNLPKIKKRRAPKAGNKVIGKKRKLVQTRLSWSRKKSKEHPAQEPKKKKRKILDKQAGAGLVK